MSWVIIRARCFIGLVYFKLLETGGAIPISQTKELMLEQVGFLAQGPGPWWKFLGQGPGTSLTCRVSAKCLLKTSADRVLREGNAEGVGARA